MARRDDMTGAVEHDDFESDLKPLWLRAQAGDEAAYREVLSRIAVRLRRYFARRLFALPDDVEDLVQETLLALHQRRGTYEPGLTVAAWVYAIARHKMVDLLRRRGRREALNEPLDDLAEDQLLTAAPDQQLTRRDLSLLLATLPPAQRLAIVLTRIEGLSVAEAAQRGGVSVSALKVQVHRGLKRLASLVRSEP